MGGVVGDTVGDKAARPANGLEGDVDRVATSDQHGRLAERQRLKIAIFENNYKFMTVWLFSDTPK